MKTNLYSFYTSHHVRMYVYVYVCVCRSVEGVSEALRGEAEPDGEGERRGQEPGRRPEMGKNYDLYTVYTILYTLLDTLRCVYIFIVHYIYSAYSHVYVL